MNKRKLQNDKALVAAALFALVGPLAGEELEESQTVTRTQSGPDVEVTVIATRSAEASLQTAGTATAITREEMTRSGAVSLGEALKYEPGVSVPFDFAGQSGFVPYLGGGDQSVNIRGLDGNRVNIQVDGIRQPEDFVAQAFLGAGGPGRIYFDPAVFEQLELFKSASSSLYGSDALGGTIAGQTVSPRSLLGDTLIGQRIENSAAVASVNNSFSNRVAGGWGDGTWAGSIVYSFRDGEERENNGSLAPNPEDFTSNAFVIKGLHQADGWSLEGTFDYFLFENITQGDAAEGVFFGGAVVNDNIVLEEERERLRLSLEGSFTPDTPGALADSFSVRGYYQNAEQRSVNLQQGTVQFGPPPPMMRDRTNDISYSTESFGIDTQAEKLFATESTTHLLRYGIEVSLTNVENAFTRIDRGMTTTATDRIGMAPSEVTRLGVFFHDEISLGLEEKWVITPGVRFEYYDVSPENTAAFLARTVVPLTGDSVEAVDYENTAIAPSLSVLYRWTPEVNSYFTYSRGIRNPSAEELNGVFTHGADFIVTPNPGLEEEVSDSFEIGIQGTRERHAFQLAAFYNRYDNFLESNVVVEDNPDPTPDVVTTVNRQEVEIYGMELRWDWRADASLGEWAGFETGVSGSWTEGERTDVGQPLNSVEPWKAVAYIGYRPEGDRWGVRLTATHIGEKDGDDIDQTTDAGVIDPVDSVTLLDLSAFYRFNEHWSLRGGINNLTDEAYFLWSTARRGDGHGTAAGAARNTQPGINGFISLNASF